MAKVRKAFDREEMYRKIMPTASRLENEELIEVLGDRAEDEINEINLPQNTEKLAIQQSTALFQNKELKWIDNSMGETILYSVTEKLVINRLEIALKKMNCCRCDRCKKDILAIALNDLKPHYVVGTKAEIDISIEKDEKTGLEVTTAILKAILNIRKNARH